MGVHKSSEGEQDSGKCEGSGVPDPQASRRAAGLKYGRLGGLAKAANTTREQRSAQSKRAQVSRAILMGLGK